MADTGLPITFPCQFPFKVVGKNTPLFESAVLTIFRKHVPDLGENAITERVSKNKNYLGITVTITATSQDQLDLLYNELSNCPEVLMAL